MIETLQVDLAHEPEFTLGRLCVSPTRRELMRDDGMREVTEHRVMQVLIVLAQARGDVITRDELVQACWNGRAVTDDAINRVISRLRKLAGGIGRGSFEISTVMKIGYRLIGSEAPGGFGDLTSAHVERRIPSGDVGRTLSGGTEIEATNAGGPVNRRGVVLGGAASFLALASGGPLLYRNLHHPAVPPEVQSLMAQARTMMFQANFDGLNQAAGLYRQVVALAPNYADGWGALAFTYSYSAHFRGREEGEALRSRARAAAARAMQFDARNGLAQAALAIIDPWHGNWRVSESMLRKALLHNPDNEVIANVQARILRMIGRYREAFDVLQEKQPRTLQPVTYASLITTLWGLGELEEMERYIERAASLYPSSFELWFQRFDIYLFIGRVDAAIAMLKNPEGRPSVSGAVLDYNVDVARAFESRAPQDIDRAMKVWSAQAADGSGGAQLAIQFAAALGRIGEAFVLADAFYFSRGFVVPDARFSGSSNYHLPDERETEFLFQPQTRAMRTDARFNRLTGMLGLERYWRESGIQPDFRTDQAHA
ncbi:winged helix-turn-helix domain-containing protein [Sphingomonas sp. JC676]|uniref:winged helix-turn-helix domain-containing protein n=1 Tax=Sphingomonas sp. JC676 TaxID=2768065 RepID=UPI0016578F3F|nr:winged helix-turn-helix domain-containing protein [Sphingomonas sp. JC676]MBC9034314.1 winged helix-turn-helix domain-containing protein [Sphingomonas sp. JC676]